MEGTRTAGGATATAVRAGAVVAGAALVAWRVDWSGSRSGLDAGSVAPPPPRSPPSSWPAAAPLYIGLLGNWLAPARLGEAARVVLGRRRIRGRGGRIGLAAVAGGAVAEVLLVLRAVGPVASAAAAAAALVPTTLAEAVPLLPGGLGSYQAAVALPLLASYRVAGGDVLAVAGIAPGLVCLAREDLGLRSLRVPGGTPATS